MERVQQGGRQKSKSKGSLRAWIDDDERPQTASPLSLGWQVTHPYSLNRNERVGCWAAARESEGDLLASVIDNLVDELTLLLVEVRADLRGERYLFEVVVFVVPFDDVQVDAGRLA